MDTHQARQLLAELELISHGTTQSWNPSGGGHNAERPAFPPGEPKPPHLVLRARLNAALTQTQVDRVADAAREAIKAAKYTPIRDEPPLGDPMWRRYVVQSDKSDQDLARFYSVDVRYIRRVRQNAA